MSNLHFSAELSIDYKDNNYTGRLPADKKPLDNYLCVYIIHENEKKFKRYLVKNCKILNFVKCSKKTGEYLYEITN